MREDIGKLITTQETGNGFVTFYIYYVPPGESYSNGVCFVQDSHYSTMYVPSSSSFPVTWTAASNVSVCLLSLGNLKSDVDADAVHKLYGVSIKDFSFEIDVNAAVEFISSSPSVMVGGTVDLIMQLDVNGTLTRKLVDRFTVYGPVSFSSSDFTASINCVGIPQGVASPCVGAVNALGQRPDLVIGGQTVTGTLVSSPSVAVLLNDISPTATTIVTTSSNLLADGFPPTGRLIIGYEEISYLSVIGGAFVNCSRGAGAYNPATDTSLPESACPCKHKAGAQVYDKNNEYRYRFTVDLAEEIASELSDATGNVILGNFQIDRQATYTDFIFSDFPPYYIAKDDIDKESIVSLSGMDTVVTTASGDVEEMLALEDSPVSRYAEKTPPLAFFPEIDASSYVPIPTLGLEGVAMIAPGEESIAALKNDGTIWVGGKNEYGQLGLGESSDYIADFFERVGSDTDWVYIAADYYILMAIKSNGTLWACGYNENGGLGVGDSAYSPSFRQIGSDTDWASVHLKYYDIIAKKTDGSIYGWGHNNFSKLGLGGATYITSPTQIGTSFGWGDIWLGYTSMFIKNSSGHTYVSGSNGYGELGVGTTDRVEVLTLLTTDTTYNEFTTLIRATIARKTDGTIWSCGRNDYGELGLGDYTQRTSFVQIGSASNWVKVAADTGSASYKHCLAINSSGELYAWGSNHFGTLGTGFPLVDQSSPVKVGTDTDWSDVETGWTASIATKTDGSLWWWTASSPMDLGVKKYVPTIASSGSNFLGAYLWTNQRMIFAYDTINDVLYGGGSPYVIGIQSQKGNLYAEKGSISYDGYNEASSKYLLLNNVNMKAANTNDIGFSVSAGGFDFDEVTFNNGATDANIPGDLRQFMLGLYESGEISINCQQASLLPTYVYLLFSVLKVTEKASRNVTSSLELSVPSLAGQEVYPPDAVAELLQRAGAQYSQESTSFSEAKTYYQNIGYDFVGVVPGTKKLQAALNDIAEQSSSFLLMSGGLFKFVLPGQGGSFFITDDSRLSSLPFTAESTPAEDIKNIASITYSADGVDYTKNFSNASSVLKFGAIETAEQVNAYLINSEANANIFGANLISKTGDIKEKVTVGIGVRGLSLEIGDSVTVISEYALKSVYTGAVIATDVDLDAAQCKVSISCEIDENDNIGYYSVEETVPGSICYESHDEWRGGWGYMPWGKRWGY